MYKYCNISICLIVEGYLDCFHFLPILKKVAKIAEQVSLEQNVGV